MFNITKDLARLGKESPTERNGSSWVRRLSCGGSIWEVWAMARGCWFIDVRRGWRWARSQAICRSVSEITPTQAVDPGTIFLRPGWHQKMSCVCLCIYCRVYPPNGLVIHPFVAVHECYFHRCTWAIVSRQYKRYAVKHTTCGNGALVTRQRIFSPNYQLRIVRTIKVKCKSNHIANAIQKLFEISNVCTPLEIKLHTGCMARQTACGIRACRSMRRTRMQSNMDANVILRASHCAWQFSTSFPLPARTAPPCGSFVQQWRGCPTAWGEPFPRRWENRGGTGVPHSWCFTLGVLSRSSALIWEQLNLVELTRFWHHWTMRIVVAGTREQDCIIRFS